MSGCKSFTATWLGGSPGPIQWPNVLRQPNHWGIIMGSSGGTCAYTTAGAYGNQLLCNRISIFGAKCRIYPGNVIFQRDQWLCCINLCT